MPGISEWRHFIIGLDDLALVKVAKDLREYPEDEDFLEEALWEIARRSWLSWAGFNKWNQPWMKK